jgi:uncharacterized protein YbaR (Trm112 family)
MTADSSLPIAFDLKVVEQLACPACIGGLRLEPDQLVCNQCGRQYPIVDGIPALIAERAENP